MMVVLLTSKGNRCQAKNIALVRKRRRAGATGAKTVARRRIDPKTGGIIAPEIEKVIHNSENNHHCARRNLIKKITNVIKMQNHTAAVGHGPDVLAEIGVATAASVPIFACMNPHAVFFSEASGYAPAVMSFASSLVGVLAFAVGIADGKVEPVRRLGLGAKKVVERIALS